MNLVLTDYPRNALVGAGVIVFIVVCMVISVFWPRRRK